MRRGVAGAAIAAVLAACAAGGGTGGGAVHADGGATAIDDAGGGAAVDAPPLSAEAGDTGPSQGADAGSCERFTAPPETKGTFSYAGGSTECDVSCGAGGRYSYATSAATIAPDLPGCTQLLGTNVAHLPTSGFCCPDLVCVRHPAATTGQDTLCNTFNAGHPHMYLCDGPAGESPPTRPGCAQYAGPNTSPTLQCCP